VTTLVRGLKRLGINGLLHKGRLSVAFAAPVAGKLTATLSTTGRHPIVLATGHAAFATAGKRTVTLTLARAQTARLRHARHLSGRLTIRFAPAKGKGKAGVVKSGISLAT
jgi:hypothetical protein